jgi:Flp pilus assembly protein TadB
MSYGDAIKKTKSQVSKSKTLEFQVTQDILFPKICVVCGTNTEKQLKKIFFGAFTPTSEYKEDYIINIPICEDCTKNINMKSGLSSKSGKLILISSLIGFIVSLILYFLTFSIFLSIGLFVVSLILPIVRHRTKIKKKVNFEDYLKINLEKDKNSLKFDFINEYYASYIDQINSTKDKSEKTEENEQKTI